MEPKGVVVFGEITFDLDRMEIRHSGRIFATTAQEFRLLKFFVDNSEYVFTREELLAAVWPERKRINGRTVDNSIARLRRKIEKDPSHPLYVQTVRGVGYKFEPFRESNTVHSTTWLRGLTKDGRPLMRALF